MSDGKIDENINTQSLKENGETSNAPDKWMSDGEIVDDDETEEPKVPINNFSHRKLTKNFRSRHDKSDSDNDVAAKSGESLDLYDY